MDQAGGPTRVSPSPLGEGRVSDEGGAQTFSATATREAGQMTQTKTHQKLTRVVVPQARREQVRRLNLAQERDREVDGPIVEAVVPAKGVE